MDGFSNALPKGWDEDSHPFLLECDYVYPHPLNKRYSCFWLRGICPLIFTKVDTADIAHTRVYARISTVPQCGDWPPGTHFGDGSGGTNSSYPTLRRCGVGLCLLEPGGIFSFGISYKLPGEILTVPRAEVSALATLVEHACEGRHITYIGDNLPVVEMFNKWHSCPGSCTRFNCWGMPNRCNMSAKSVY